MLLSELLREAGMRADLAADPEIHGLKVDSRRVEKGDLFLSLNALKGVGKDEGGKGPGYAEEALARGAAAVLAEGSEHPTPAVIAYPGLRAQVGPLFDAWLGHPARGLLSIGVTGTNGKSTITKLTASLLKAAGHKPISLGTISYEIGDETLPSDLTTPGPEAFFRMLRAGRDRGCDALAMEVSSHALSQDRVRGITFDRALFTNLTQDHMDYHADFEDYFQAKKRLFTDYLSAEGTAILNLDSPYGQRLAGELAGHRFTFSRERDADVALLDSELTLEGTRFRASFRGNSYSFSSRLVGGINLENLLATVALGFSLGLDGDTISRGIAEVTVTGRNQVFALPQGAFAVVDYAHTPDALERVLSSLRPMAEASRGRLCCLFGCGGDRDRAKRPIMGAIAARLSDRAFLTSDNPRTEDPHAILEEIAAGIGDKSKVVIIPDRGSAIATALESLEAGDCLLIAGKGHEEYQIVGKEKRHFSDQEQILAWCAAQPSGAQHGT